MLIAFSVQCLSDLDKLDNEKNEMNDTDIAALHHFYSRHLDFPDNAALTELFAQVKLAVIFISVKFWGSACFSLNEQRERNTIYSFSCLCTNVTVW